jgi:hypothetical protein
VGPVRLLSSKAARSATCRLAGADAHDQLSIHATVGQVLNGRMGGCERTSWRSTHDRCTLARSQLGTHDEAAMAFLTICGPQISGRHQLNPTDGGLQ